MKIKQFCSEICLLLINFHFCIKQKLEKVVCKRFSIWNIGQREMGSDWEYLENCTSALRRNINRDSELLLGTASGPFSSNWVDSFPPAVQIMEQTGSQDKLRFTIENYWPICYCQSCWQKKPMPRTAIC